MNAKSIIILRSGNAIPQIGLGTWQTEEPERTVADALKLGRLTASSRAEFESLLSDVAQDAS